LKDEIFAKLPDIYAMHLKTAQEKYASQWPIIRYFTRPNPAKIADRRIWIKGEKWKDWFIRWLNAKFSR
jgi:hypothetical protein